MAEPAIRIMNDDEVALLTGMPRSTRYNMTRRGEFPAPVWLNSRRRGYLSDEIFAWIEERRASRTTAQDHPWAPNTTRSNA